MTKSPSGIKSLAMNQLRAIEDNCISAHSHRSKKQIEESKISFEQGTIIESPDQRTNLDELRMDKNSTERLSKS